MNLNELESAVHQTCSESQWQWFKCKRAALQRSAQLLGDLAIVLAMARRKVGHHTITEQWCCDEAVRVLFIKMAQTVKPDLSTTVVSTAYQQGDEYEREAILKGLVLLDASGKLVLLAEEACRTNIVTLFVAISQHNPYPEQHFDEGRFNQMVLKSLFLDLNIETIVGLSLRVNPALTRMCYDYLRERLAAGRSVPASLWLTLNMAWVNAEQEFIHFLRHENAQHRYYVALSLSWQSVPAAVLAVVKKQLSVEPNPDVLALLQCCNR